MSIRLEVKKTVGIGVAAIGLFVLVQLFHVTLNKLYSHNVFFLVYPVIGFACAAICFSIFYQSWSVLLEQLSLQRLFIAPTFLVVGLLYLVHIVSVSFLSLTDFALSSSISLWLLFVNRAFTAAMFLIICLLPYRKMKPGYKTVALWVGIGCTLLILGVIKVYGARLPDLRIRHEADALGWILNLAIIFLLVSTIVFGVRRYREFHPEEHGMLLIIRGTGLCVVSQLFYMSSERMSDVNHLMGFLSNTMAFYILLSGLVRQMVLVPYREKQAAESEFNLIAYTDDITGLPNRRRLSQRLDKMLRDSLKPDETVALLVLNIDRFKTINDSLGHMAGNYLLYAVGERLGHFSHEGEEVFSMGGDEFAFLLTGYEDMGAMRNRIDDMVKLFDQPFPINGESYHVMVSVGIALYPLDADQSEQLIQNADTAVHSAKEQGVNFQRYTSVMQMRAHERLQLENDLRRALENEEFSLVYQPRIHLQSGELTSLEALVRWNHPQRGMVMPGDFISVAEESGLIVPLGEWVLREACLQNKRWQEAGYQPIPISVNLSMRQFQQKKLVDVIQGILAYTELEPCYLELEITESMTFDKDRAFEQLKKIKAIGVAISIDDFGTGYSSLHYLKNLPIDRLKIDRSFVNEVLVDSKNAAIVSTIASMAHHLKLKVTAEGVENEEQLHFLQAQECHEGQGYYFSRPIPAEAFEKLFLREPMNWLSQDSM
ncbi:EAL domain-containing protein [Paenibacillus peoriae]|uniref:bifunctional diguanylate cyclase/phosphodiesterase n=1 Tax=Paenibacillus peoriae TaxID=59893 RepID=UPI00026C5958|nr:EAL domain-containing protein [Paenibacillus peoriae]MEC0180566.1 EAL domain-containing protein [Paenibacillus peoriae]